MKYEELIFKLNKRELGLNYLFSGEEDFLKEKAILKIKQLLTENTQWHDFNYNLFYGYKKSAKEIINCAQTLPFMAKRRMIVVKEADKFTAEDEGQFFSYLKEPSDGTCLIFCAGEAKKIFFKEINKLVEHVIFYHPYESKIPAWIKKELSQYNKYISDDACVYLRDEVGNNLIDLHNEIEKLVSYVKDRKEIDVQDVQSIVGHTKVDNIFYLQGEIGNKQGDKALKIMKNLIEKGEKPVKILGAVVNYIRNIMEAKILLGKGRSYEEIRNSLGINTFYFKEFMGKLNNFSNEELKEKFHLLLLADKEIKTGKKEPSLALELLILKLTGQINSV